jgi:undecaprenyl-diphosphatase
MDFIQSIILGIVQGLSEFLPISSSGHLVILPWIFNWQDQGLAFDVALHWGTLLAVLAYFRKEWIEMFKSVIFSCHSHSFFCHSRESGNPPLLTNQLFFFILLASIPGAISGFLFKNLAENIFRSPLLIVFTLSGFAFFLWWFDKKGKKEIFLKNLNWRAALFIGFSQALAIIPGVSRSERRAAARFSFLLAAPIIFGAGLVKIPSLINGNINFPILPIGILSSSIAGFLAIKYLLRYLETRSYNIFVYYRIIFALVILGMVLMR